MKLFVYLFSCLFLLISCAPPEAGDSHLPREAQAKHLHGSCAEADACGEQSNGTCWCDDLCVYYDDCCADAAEFCGVEAEPEPEPSCTTDDACSDGEFCAFSEGCGGDGTEGECVERPEFCIQVYDPVCGCDGQTYGNACEAAAAGVNVAQVGECTGAPDSCHDNCGGSSDDGSCWCDAYCETFGDCCDDVADYCD